MKTEGKQIIILQLIISWKYNSCQKIKHLLFSFQTSNAFLLGRKNTPFLFVKSRKDDKTAYLAFKKYANQMLNFIFDNPGLYLENHLLEKYRKGIKSLLKAGLRIWRISRLVTDWRNIETSARNRKAFLSNFSKLSKKIKYSRKVLVFLYNTLYDIADCFISPCLSIDKFPQLLFIPRFYHNQWSLKLPLGKRNSFIAVGCKWWHYRILGFRAEYKKFILFAARACALAVLQ